MTMSDKRNILFVMDGLKIGGVEFALSTVLQRIDYRKFDVDLLILHNHLGIENQINKNVKIINLEVESQHVNSPAFLYRYSVFKFCSILHMQNAADKAAKAMQHCSQRLRCKKLLLKEYDTVIAYKQGEAEEFVVYCVKAKKKIAFYHHGSLMDEKLHSDTYMHFDFIVAVSEGVRSMLQSRYPSYANKIIVIPNYICADTILRRAEEYMPDFPSDRLVICSVGRLCREKRFDRAIKAAKMMRNQGMRFCWFIIGDGELRDELTEQIVQYQLSKYVYLTGKMMNPLPYVKHCNVYVQTSDAESFGLAILEAQVLGKPVVSTKTIGGNLLVRHKENGYLVSKFAEDIVTGIEWCINEFKQTQRYTQYEKADRETEKLWLRLLE